MNYDANWCVLFCGWLSGYQRIVNGAPTPEQWAEIKKKLEWAVDAPMLVQTASDDPAREYRMAHNVLRARK